MKITKLISIITLFLSLNLKAQFGSPIIIDDSLSINQRNIVTFDVDNDGKKDIVLSSFFNNIVWYKNLGTGFGASQSITSTFAAPYHLDFADVNGDGFKDLVATNNASNNSGVSVFMNNNGGNSWSEIVLDSNLPNPAFKSFFVDIENDGDMDVISNLSTKIMMYKNNGMGVFTTPIQIESATEYYSMTVADFNGNGFKDIIVNTGNFGVEIFTNNTLGTFNSPTTIFNNGISFFLSSFDIDDDGDIDVLSGSLSANQGVDFFSNELNAFNKVYTVSQINNFDVPLSQFHHSKLNSDAFFDLLIVDNNNSKLYWKENNQMGEFGDSILIEDSYLYKNVYSADLDNDGDNDIIWLGINTTTHMFNLGYMDNENSLSVENFNFENGIKLFPNPATNELAISFSEKVNCRLSIYDIMGNFIYEQDLVDKVNDLDIAFLPQGIYLIKLNSEQYEVSYKFIKQ